MSCCGSPKDSAPANSKPQTQHTGPIVTQPTFQPGLEKPQFFQQPSISPPPAVHANNSFTVNGFQQPGQPAWGQSPSPPLANDFGTLTNSSPMPSTTPTFNNGSTYNGSTFNVNSGFSSMSQPMMLPRSAHMGHMSISTSPAPVVQQLTGSQAQDEGKMSISIDFGAHICHYAHSYSHFALRYHFLWCCKYLIFISRFLASRWLIGLWLVTYCWRQSSANFELARIL
jgi:hypothetical protein